MKNKEQRYWKAVRVQGSELLDGLKQVIHEGNARRMIIKKGDWAVAEFSPAAGVVGAMLIPVLSIIGAPAALMNDCSIEAQTAGRQSGIGFSEPADLI